jgi:(4-O-methyl)-D-glucuronate---lignin esterase
MSGPGWKENNFTPLPALPANGTSANIPKLPDPFKFIDGSRISSKGDWEKLRADLSAMLQASVYGPKMPPPDKLTATFSGGTVTVNMTVGSKTGSFTFKVSGGNATNPVPAIITCNASSLPVPSGVVKIQLSTDTFAAQNKMIPTTGLVSTLYGSAAAKSGSDICWAWGLSRMIDALELVPEAGINVKRIATTGCSYAGKGALAMGAFDERVALTIVEEGGSGGTALWRVSTAEAKAGQNIQEATEIVGEQNWEGADFKALFSGKAKASAPVEKLLADMHFAVALCAPRAILILENDLDWLGPTATYGGGVAGRTVFEALGIKDRCGVSVAPNHGHCSMPSSQQAGLTAFFKRFIQGGMADTSGVDTFSGKNSTLGSFKPADWIDWTTPTLSGSLSWDPFPA